VGELRAVEVVDHVVPHRGDMSVFWHRDLWQSACRWHHDVIKPRLEAMRDRGEIGAAELWLDSQPARRLTIQLRPTPV